MSRLSILLAFLAALEALPSAQLVFRGTTQPPSEMPFRQNNQFFDLTRAAEPRPYVILDGRTKK